MSYNNEPSQFEMLSVIYKRLHPDISLYRYDDIESGASIIVIELNNEKAELARLSIYENISNTLHPIETKEHYNSLKKLKREAFMKHILTPRSNKL
jgi:hypothetical protein